MQSVKTELSKSAMRVFLNTVQSLSSVRFFVIHAVMDYSMPGLPVHRQLPEFTQTHVHWVGDAIQ